MYCEARKPRFVLKRGETHCLCDARPAGQSQRSRRAEAGAKLVPNVPDPGGWEEQAAASVSDDSSLTPAGGCMDPAVAPIVASMSTAGIRYRAGTDCRATSGRGIQNSRRPPPPFIRISVLWGERKPGAIAASFCAQLQAVLKVGEGGISGGIRRTRLRSQSRIERCPPRKTGRDFGADSWNERDIRLQSAT